MKPKLLVLASTFPGTPGDGTPAFVLDLALQQAKDFDVTVLTPMVPGALARQTITAPAVGIRTSTLNSQDVGDGSQPQNSSLDHSSLGRSSQNHAPLAQEVSIEVIRFRYWFKGTEDLAHGAILDNLKAKKSRFLQVPMLAHGLFWGTRKFVKQHNPVAIHAHWVIPQGILATLASPKTPLLVTTHGGDIYALNHPLLLRLKRWVFNRAAAITTVNSQMKQQLVAWGQPPQKVTVLPMGVDTVTVGGIAAAASKSVGKMLVVGRLVEKKGIEYLFDAMRILLKSNDNSSQPAPGEFTPNNMQLTIIGDGPIRNQLQAKATGLPVTFLGQRGRDQVLQAIAESEIMVIPSVTASNGDQEGLPVTLLEGGAGQICVIASNLPGIDEVITDGESGLLVPQRNAQALAEALQRALTSPQLRAKLAQGIATSVKRFDIGVIGAGYNQILRQIASEKN